MRSDLKRRCKKEPEGAYTRRCKKEHGRLKEALLGAQTRGGHPGPGYPAVRDGFVEDEVSQQRHPGGDQGT